MATSACNDTSEAIEMFEPQGLYLKPIAKVNVSCQLPQLKSNSGKSLSNWEVMEKLKHMVKPDTFVVLKVIKSMLEFIRFEGELENKRLIKVFIDRLDSKTIKLSGFPESLKVRACEAKPNFPTRHDWDSFFRDAKHMNEMKPGERPDTLYLRELPSRWFANRKDHNKDKPSEYVLKKVFETFGDIRCVDIPMLDPYRKEMTCNTGAIQTFSYGQDLTFDAFIQYKEYIGFVKAMNALKGMKLMYKDRDAEDKAYTVVIKVDFDKSKHLSDKAIRKRRLEREKLMELERQKEAARDSERRKLEEMEESRRLRKEQKIRRKEDRRQLREEKRKLRQLEQKQMEEERIMQERIALEERKILIAQRKLETIRLLSELFCRVKVVKQQEEVEKHELELEEQRKHEVEAERKARLEAEQKKLEAEKRKQRKLERKEQQLRQKILNNLKTVEHRKAEQTREELRKKISGKTKLKSMVSSAKFAK